MRLDPHSYADDSQPSTEHLDWEATVDFDRRELRAKATLTFAQPGSGLLDLDTRDLRIDSVVDDQGRALTFELAPADPILGQRLQISLLPGTAKVTLAYRTSPTASALQWLTPAQTRSGAHPFLFSQCQAIHARSVVPLQDTPRLRIRYRARLDVPASLRALMGAGHVSREERGERAVETWEMPQPIAPYLFALVVGELSSRELGPRTRVWAEPSCVDAAAYEFGEVGKMLAAAEALFGPYDWDRFDFLVLPPSFPYGGMENPRLTFLTPTLLAGDRSLANVLAHELAHSWAGNLITNANAEHFWLNEGLTVYAERRILEALEGREVSELHAAIGRKSLEDDVDRFADRPQLTKLHTHLSGVDPDDAYSQVPYEKGYLLFRALEEHVGRVRFDAFLRAYLAAFRFQSITTDQFVAFADQALPSALEEIGAPAYFDLPGIPPNAPRASSSKLEAIQRLGPDVPAQEVAEEWNPTEWQVFLGQLKPPLARATLETLDQRFGLTQRTNDEVLVTWLELAARSNYEPALPRIEEVLGRVGRMKYLKPLYRALLGHAETRERARAWFAKFREGYHPIAAQVVEALFAKS